MISQINELLLQIAWVHETGCRVRELGHVLHVEAFVVVVGVVDVDELTRVREQVARLDAVLSDVAVIPVGELPEGLTGPGQAR